MGPWGMGRYVNSVVLLQVESCRPQRTEPTSPLSSQSVLQSPAVVPTWRTTFLQVEDGSLDSRKTKWISPDRAPRSQKTQMCLGVHSLGRALARQNTRPDMCIIIKQCHPHDRWKKKMRLNRLHRPCHATPRPSQVRSRLPAKAIGRRHAAKAGAEHYLPVRG